MLRRFLAMPVAAGLVLALSACATREGPSQTSIPGLEDQASYEAAFQAARDELRDRGYLLDRVDAAAGVITTQRSGVPGGVGDVLNRQRHYVRVTFSPPGGEVVEAGSRTVDVRVITERVSRPGWRVPPASVRLSSTTADPSLDDRGLRPVYAVPIEDDASASAELLGAIRRRIGHGA